MENKKNLNTITKILVVSIIAAVLFAVFCITRTEVTIQNIKHEVVDPDALMDSTSSMTDINDGWTVIYEDGTTEDITLPCSVTAGEGESITITRDMSGVRLVNSVIAFNNNRYGVAVFADNEPLYQSNTTSLSGQIKYTGYRLVVIPYDIDEVEIVYSASENGIYELEEIQVGTLQDAKYEIIENNLFTIILLIILLVLGITFLGFLLYYLFKKEYKTRIGCILAFLICAILWGVADSSIPSLTRIDQEVAGVVCYTALMLLPIPMTLFVWHATEMKNKVLELLIILNCINVLAQLTLSLTGAVGLHKMFIVSHAFSFVDMVVCIIMLRKHRKASKKNRENLLTEIGIIAISVSAVLAMVMYWAISPDNYRNSLLIGIIVFLMLLFASVVDKNIKRRKAEELQMSEAKIYEELSMHDQLTGLKNRRAFEQQMSEIEANVEATKDAVLIMMDINGLKITNDQYGHSAGDELILSAAKTIGSVYANDGNCYRIGGDEFVVVMINPKNSVNFYDKQLLEKIEKHNENSTWKLSIARGDSHLVNSAGIRLSISDWKQEADIKMYRNKVSMNTGNNRNLAKDLQSIIDCIVMTLEARDVYTADHSVRVSELSVFIGTKLGVSGATLDNIGRAASLHDIGKVGIPDSILRKAGPLTPEEFEIISRHSAIGADIISKAKGMYDISQIVLHHHERYDGKGYPDGISGTDIPLESRIITIADSIDAMTSKRIYRDSMSLDECRAEIERNIGTQFDPAIAQIVLRNWSGISDIVLLHPKRLMQEAIS